MRVALAILPLIALCSEPARACTICHTPTSLGVRHLLFEHDFLYNVAAIAAPIPLLLLIILLAAREPSGKGGRHE